MKTLFPKSVVVLASILSMSGCGRNLHVNVPSQPNVMQPALATNVQVAPARDGMNGSKILFGTINPSPLQGQLGDVFMNTTSGDIFNLEATGWVLKGNFKGPKGDDGIKGLEGVPGTNSSNKISSGLADPSNEVGAAGDLYINQSSTELFQKSSDGKWSPLFKMKGDRGEKGEANPGMFYGSGSPTGEQTPVGGSYLDVATGDYYTRLPDGSFQKIFHFGTNGTNGTEGTQVLDGVGIPDSKLGAIGDYYFEDLTGDLYRKDVDGKWKVRMSLGHQNSPVGLSSFFSGEGPGGANAIPVGAVYLDTLTGDLYTKRIENKTELLMNIKGTSGSAILNGKGTPANSLGAAGDYYLNTDSMELSTKDKTGIWVVLGTLRGDMGPQGPKGDPGSMVTSVRPAPVVVDLPLSLENAQLGFQFGKSEINQVSTEKLVQTAQLLKKYAQKIAKVRVVGHADKYGAESTNLNLSKNRANSVAIVLGKNGLDAYKFIATKGEGEPTISLCQAANSGDQTKGEHLKCANDRRVDINLMFDAKITIAEKNAIILEIKQDFNGIWNK